MTVLYLDANALAKLYLNETGRERVVRAVEATPQVVVSAIGYAEVRGVFARRLQEGTFSEDEHAEAVNAFHADWETVSVIDVSRSVSRLAGDVLKAHRAARLRAMDALHLAVALETRRAVPLRFLTFDADLERVARALMPDAV